MAVMLPKKFKIVIEKCTLMARKVDLASEIYNLHHHKYQHEQLNYPYIKSVIRVAHIATGTVNATIENIFNSQTLPQLLVLGLITTESYNGKLSKSCFNIRRNKLSSLQVNINNEPCGYSLLTLGDDDYVLALEHLYRNLNLNGMPTGISRLNWTTGYALYAFRLYPNVEQTNASLSINLTFGTGTTENITLIATGQAASVLSTSAQGVEVSNKLT